MHTALVVQVVCFKRLASGDYLVFEGGEVILDCDEVPFNESFLFEGILAFVIEVVVVLVVVQVRLYGQRDH